MNKLIGIAVGLTLVAVSSGHLSKIVKMIRRAQFELIQESKASKWPRATYLPDQ
ncbi:MAG TPA: hypothetical protein VNJ08_14390 [Bacteriovoracaceae bacterium]|nr:hypothetical protein [Bacteriovoracaceae bacterium]